MKTRLDWLEEQLDRENLPEPDRQRYEAEADKIAARITKNQEEAEAKSQQRVDHINMLYACGQFAELRKFYGEEFAKDYECRQEGDKMFVYSNAARDWQNCRWEVLGILAGHKKITELIGYRIYNKYVRGDRD